MGMPPVAPLTYHGLDEWTMHDPSLRRSCGKAERTREKVDNMTSTGSRYMNSVGCCLSPIELNRAESRSYTLVHSFIFT